MRLRVCVRGCRGRPRIASLWDSLTTAGVFPRVSRRRPFTGVDLREIRPPNFCSFYRPLVSDHLRSFRSLSPCSPLWRFSCLPDASGPGATLLSSRKNVLATPKPWEIPAGNAHGRILGAFLLGGGGEATMLAITFTGSIAVPLNRKHLLIRANATIMFVTTK